MSVTLAQCRARPASFQDTASGAACDELIATHCAAPGNRYADECACYWKSQGQADDVRSALTHCFTDECKKPGALKLNFMTAVACPSGIDCVQKVFVYGSGDGTHRPATVSGVSAAQLCADQGALEERERLQREAVERAKCEAGKRACTTAVGRRLQQCALARATGAVESAWCKALREAPPQCGECGTDDIEALIGPEPVDPDVGGKPKEPPATRPDVWDVVVFVVAALVMGGGAYVGPSGFLASFVLMGGGMAIYFWQRGDFGGPPKAKDSKGSDSKGSAGANGANEPK